MICDALALDETELDDVAHVAAAHEDAGVDVGAGVGVTGGGAPLPPPHAASNKTSPSAEAGTR